MYIFYTFSNFRLQKYKNISNKKQISFLTSQEKTIAIL